MWSLRAWRRRRLLRRHALPEPLWQAAVDGFPLFGRLGSVERLRLRELATLLLATKTIDGADGFEPDDAVRVAVAALAALPILGLDLDCDDDWHEIVLYPDAFV